MSENSNFFCFFLIMVSAYGDMRNIREAMNNGAFDFATKPIDMDEFRPYDREGRQPDTFRA